MEDSYLIDILKVVRELNLPDWFVGAGFIRNRVWDALENYPIEKTRDVDIAYFDKNNCSAEKDKKIEQILLKKRPEIKWDVFNQARSHIRNPKKPIIHSTAEGIATWFETPTCVGVRLEKDDTITVCAPWGLEDLMSLTVNPVPFAYKEPKLYNERLKSKKWKERWPKLKINLIS